MSSDNNKIIVFHALQTQAVRLSRAVNEKDESIFYLDVLQAEKLLEMVEKISAAAGEFENALLFIKLNNCLTPNENE